MNKDIAPQATSAVEQTKAESNSQLTDWDSILWVTPRMVEQILEANDLADATEEQA